MYFAAEQWRDQEIVFLLEIEYLGREYRFSTFPIYIQDETDQIPFEGGLNSFDFAQNLNQIGKVKRQLDSISLGITFPFNVALRQIQGKGIELSICKLFYILTREGEPPFLNYSEKVILYTGVLTDPIYGHPDQDVGYVEFSIENEIIISDQSFLSKIVGENIMIEDAAFSAPKFEGIFGLIPPTDLDGIIDVQDMHRGKAAPVIIGSPGITTTQMGDPVAFGASPAYLIAYENTGPDYPAYYLIAGHPVLAETVKMYDNKGHSQDNIVVREFVSRKGGVYSYVILEVSTPIDRSFVVNTDLEYWIEWDDGSGLPSSVGPGAISGGGDLCIWALNALDIDYDREGWQGLRDRLNEYLFSGYINDPKIKMFQWLERNVISFLPVSVSAGPRGLTPILDLRLESSQLSARLKIIANPTFSRHSALSPVSSSSEVVNNLICRFSPSGFSSPEGSPYVSYVRSSYDRIPGVAAYEDVSPYAILSYQRYGERTQVISLDYVYSAETASKIANNYMRQNALPSRSVEYRSNLSYGFLELGDIIEIDDSDIGLSNAKCQIISKRYEGSSWIYGVLVEENPILNIRPII